MKIIGEGRIFTPWDWHIFVKVFDAGPVTVLTSR